MFDLTAAETVEQRMHELSNLIEFWYGPHNEEFEVRDLPSDLPLALQLFYQRHGRRPPLQAEQGGSFYEGEGLHHLFRPQHLESVATRLKFFMEYQGDFDGFTDLASGDDDPPVYLQGHLPETQFTNASYGHLKREHEEQQLPQSLSHFLVTHVLITTLSESHNTRKMVHAKQSDPIYTEFHAATDRKQLIWEASDPAEPHCTWYIGKIYLYRDTILVHEFLDQAMFSSRFLTESGEFSP